MWRCVSLETYRQNPFIYIFSCRLLNMSEKTNGRDYEEERDYYNKDLDLQYSFIFITKCFSRRLKHLLDDYPQRFGSYPDMILINSVGFRQEKIVNVCLHLAKAQKWYQSIIQY